MQEPQRESPRTNPAPASRPESPSPTTPRAPRREPVVTPKRLDRLFLYRRGDLGFDQVIGFRGGAWPNRQGRKLVLWSWTAALIDAFVLLSASCVFLMSFAWIVQTSPSQALASLAGAHYIVGFLLLFAVCAWVYLITLRCLCGFTIGEWACDLRLGQPHQRLMKTYPMKVLLRSSLVIVTGLLVLPLLSLLTGRDWAGRLSGVSVMSLR